MPFGMPAVESLLRVNTNTMCRCKRRINIPRVLPNAPLQRAISPKIDIRCDGIMPSASRLVARITASPHQCIRASVHPCIRASVHQCISASVHQCINALVH